jgi:hypothetical protein
MSSINAQLIEVNTLIMEGNAEVVKFNSEQVKVNGRFVDGEVQPSKATPSSNATRIKANAFRMTKIIERAISNAESLDGELDRVLANRANITKNDAVIHARRDAITETHFKIGQNRDVLSGNTLVEGGVFSVDGSSESGADGGLRAGMNAADVQANRAKLFELETSIEHNKFAAYATRALIEENFRDIMKNYAAAMGNRTMANENTAAIFRNRKAILLLFNIEGAVQENFIQSKLNESQVDYLEHRSKMNQRVAAINQKLSKINSALIEINSMIMAGNEEVANFNAKHVEINRRLLEGELKPSSATPESNAERIKSNTARMTEILDRALANSETLEAGMKRVLANRAQIAKNYGLILSRRQTIKSNHAKMMKNGRTLTQRGALTEAAADAYFQRVFGPTLAKGMTEIWRTKPADPLAFLGQWLLDRDEALNGLKYKMTDEQASAKIAASMHGIHTRKQIRNGNADKFIDKNRADKIEVSKHVKGKL